MGRIRRRSGHGALQRARHRAGGHPQGGPGAEHLHLLHRFRPQDDGRYPGSISSKTMCAISTRYPSPATTSPKPAPTPSASWPSPWPTGSPTWSTTCPAACRLDSFGPNLSFFFSNGMDPEYTVIGRVARRIWSVALREKYGASVAQPDAQVPHPDLRPQPAQPGHSVQ
jgi:hypothetical protein